MAFTAVNLAKPHVAAGNMRILAVLLPPGYPGRFPALPDVPVLMESLPNFEKPVSWFAYFGPAGMTQPVVRRLNAEIVKAINTPDSRAKLEAAGLGIIGNTPEQFAAVYRAGFPAYAQITKAAGIVPE